jgi:hypothetical protein
MFFNILMEYRNGEAPKNSPSGHFNYTPPAKIIITDQTHRKTILTCALSLSSGRNRQKLKVLPFFSNFRGPTLEEEPNNNLVQFYKSHPQNFGFFEISKPTYEKPWKESFPNSKGILSKF